VDTPHASLTAVLNVGPTNASAFTLNADGSFNYTPNANYSGSDSFTYHAFDGTLSSNIVTVSLTINAVDDAPVITRPATATTNEDTTFTFNGGNVISIADVDAAAGSETVTLGVSNGVLNLSGTTGLTVSGNGTNSITASGTLTNLNNALNGMTYTPSLNYNGSDTLSIGVNDNGNTGTGGPLTDSKSVAITVNPVNDAPVAVADPYSTNEDTPLVVAAVSGVLANDTDVDTPHASLTAVLNVGPTNASAFTLNSDGSFSYTPNANFSGSDSFTYHAFDGALNSGIVTVSLTINAVDDAPVNAMPPTPTMNQDATLTMTPAANAIQVSDVDAGGNSIQVQLNATNGTMTLSGTSGLSFSAGDGTADATMTFTGTIANINTALVGLQFTSSPGFFGTATIQIVTNDLGFTGAGGPQTDTDTLNITVLQQDQPPVNTVPAAQSVNEDVTLTFSSGNSNAISIADPDAGANPVKVTLTVTQGTLTLSGITGLSFSVGDGSSDATMTFTGTISAINTALQGMSYLGNSNYNGSDTLTITTNDQGFSGPGGPLSDTDTVNITINPVNDAPVAVNDPAVAGTYDVFKYTASSNTSLSINAANGVLGNDTDVDTAHSSLTAILVVGPVHSQSFTLNPDGSFTYVPTTGYVGTDTFTYKANDGSLDSNVATATITVKNHAPSGGIDGFGGVGNTDLEVSTTFFTGPRVHLTGNLLTNDTDLDGDTLSTVGETVPGSLGGSATINTDGTFRYSPAVSATSETFTYHVTDGTDITPVVVTITLTNRVWYAKNNVANGTGTSSSPFNTLAGANTASAANEFIYVFNGDGSSTGYNGNFTLKSGVSLIGEGVVLTVGANNLSTAGTKPTLTNTTPGVILQVGTGATVRGVHLASTGTAAAITNSGNALGTMNVGDVLIDGVGGAFNLNTSAAGSGSLTVDNSTINFAAGTGSFFQATTTNVTVTFNANNTISYTGATPLAILTNSGSTFTFNSAMTLSASSGQGSIVLSGNTNSPVTFAGNLTLNPTGTATNAILLNANLPGAGTGLITFSGTVTISSGAIAGVTLTGNTAAVTFSGTSKAITTTTAGAFSMGTANTGAVTFSNGGLVINTTSGAALTASGGGTLTISGAGNTITTTAAGKAIDINGTTSGGITFATVNTNGGGPATAIALQSLGNGSVTINGGTLNGTGNTITFNAMGTSTTTLSGVTVNSSTNSIVGVNFGTLAVGGTTNVTATGTAISLNTGTLSGSFNNVNSSGGANGVILTGVTISGTVAVTGGALTGASGATFSVSGGGTGTLNWGGTITQANGALAVSIAGGNNGTINFNGNVTANTTSTGININGSSGIYSFAGTTNAISGSGGGVSITGETGGSVTFNSGTSISTIATPSFNLTTSAANVTYSGTISQITVGAKALNIATYSGTLLMNGTSITASNAAPGGVLGATLSAITGTVTINAVTVTANNNNFAGNPVVGISGINTGSITFNGLAISANGNSYVGSLLDIAGTNTGASFTFNHLVLSANGTGHTGKGLTAAGGGTLTITATGGASSIDAGSTAIDLNAQTLGASALGTVNSAGGVNGIKFTTVNGGTMTITGGSIAGNSGAALLIAGGTGGLSYGGTITQNTAGQRAVDISGKTAGTVTLSALVTSSGGSGVFLNSNTGASITLSGGMTLSTGAVAAFTATGGGTVNVSGTNNITTTSGTGINWNGCSGTSATFNNVTSSTGGAVSVTSAGATNFTFNDVTSTTGKAVGVDTVSGVYVFHAINANGAVDGVTVNAASGSFTVNGTSPTAGSGGTITACTHNGMKFTTANNVTLKFMNLTNNGSAETVVGGGAGCSNNFGSSDNLSCVANLNLQTVTGATLTNLSVTGSGQEGINGNNVTTFSLKNSTVTGNGNTSAENGLNFQGMFGTCDITDTTVQNNAQVQIRIENLVNGALNLTVKKQALATMNIGYTTAQLALPSQQGLFINTLGTASVALTVDGITALNNFGAGVSVNNQGSGGMTGSIQNSVFQTNNVGIIIQSAGAAGLGTSNASPFLIQNNSDFRNNQVQAILISTTVASTGSIFAKINANQIGTLANACNIAGGFNNCDGIDVRRFSTNPFNVTISGNTIQRVAGTSIAVISDKSGNSSFNIASNNISIPFFDANNTGAIAISAVGGSSAGGNICLGINTNTIDAGSATFGWDPNGAAAPVNVQVKNSAVISIPGLGTTTDAGVIAYLPTQNTIANNVNGIKAYAKSNFPTPGSWAGGAACSTP
ncbi:MAG TPA: Ig-like domain-containing protein, partial [Thermoanaerobaculia bacterium]|nr:Ig-like domain-containing protein [Thermoanaerobaculia bacterium]